MSPPRTPSFLGSLDPKLFVAYCSRARMLGFHPAAAAHPDGGRRVIQVVACTGPAVVFRSLQALLYWQWPPGLIPLQARGLLINLDLAFGLCAQPFRGGSSAGCVRSDSSPIDMLYWFVAEIDDRELRLRSVCLVYFRQLNCCEETSKNRVRDWAPPESVLWLGTKNNGTPDLECKSSACLFSRTDTVIHQFLPLFVRTRDCSFAYWYCSSVLACDWVLPFFCYIIWIASLLTSELKLYRAT
jgi:hypothetical protein